MHAAPVTPSPPTSTTQVLCVPDCSVAVLLMEHSLACRFGDSYSGLGLPPLMALMGSGEDDATGSLDAALKATYGLMAQQLRGFAPMGWAEE